MPGSKAQVCALLRRSKTKESLCLGKIIDRNMSNNSLNNSYNSSWGNEKIGKLWIHCKDLLENGKRPLLPASTFYSNWNGTEKDLAIMAGKILKYLKFQSMWVLRVDFVHDLSAPGMFSVKNNNAKILVHKKYNNNSTACAAILAHEITHLVLNSKHCREENELENERFTDFAAVYLGLGILVLNGKYSSRDKPKKTSFISFLIDLLITPLKAAEEEYSFGYWEIDQYHTIFTGYLLRNNLDWDNISLYIKKGTKYAGLS